MSQIPDYQNAENNIRLLLEEALGLLQQDFELALQKAHNAYQLSIAIHNDKCAHLASNFMGKALYQRGHYRESLEQYQKALEHCVKTGDTKRVALYLNNVGLLHFALENWPQAIDYYNQSLELRQKLGDEKGVGITLLNLGGTHLQRGSYAEALQCYIASQSILEKYQETALLATATYNAGLIHSIDSNYTEAINCYHKAMQHIAPHDYASMANIYNDLGDAYTQCKQYKDAEQYLTECLNISNANNYKKGRVAAMANLSTLLFVTARYDACLTQTNELIQEPLADKNSLVVAQLNMGRVYFAKGEHPLAQYHLEVALHLAQSIEAKHLLQDILTALVHLYEHLRDYKSAFEKQQAYLHLKDDLYQSKLTQKLSEQKMQHEVLLQQQEMEAERSRSEALKTERDKADHLLKNILPDAIAEELKNTGKAEPKLLEQVSVLFTDFVHFTQASEGMSPQALVNELHCLFKAFDEIAQRHHLEKIKTIGDSYMAAAGIPHPDTQHARNAVAAALEIASFMRGKKFEIRIGIHSGPVVAGIVGIHKFQYDIWGDTVNTASRMESSGAPGRVNISEATYALVKEHYHTEYRGEIAAKNKGMLKMYFVIP